jgi:hypothetical protein
MCKTSDVLRGLIKGALLLVLFMMTSLPAWAHGQQRQGFQSPIVASIPSAPSGNAKLQWNQQTNALNVTVQVSGLQAGSTHAEHIHAGTCANEGKILYPLNNIVADKAGNATVTSTVNNVSGGIPATGWTVTVHSGSTAQSSGLLCGNVTNPNKATSVSVALQAAPK